MGYRFKLICGFSDAIIPQGPRVGLLTLFLFIHPLWPLRCARITYYGELHDLASGQRNMANVDELVTKLLCTQYPCTLEIGSVPSAQSENKNTHFEQDRPEDFKQYCSGY